jgi:hypothetical protein
MRSQWLLKQMMQNVKEGRCKEKFSDLMGTIAIATHTKHDPAFKHFQDHAKKNVASFLAQCDFAVFFKHEKLIEHQLTADDLREFIPAEEIASINLQGKK